MAILGLSDLHLEHAASRTALQHITAHSDDLLLLAGDVTNDPSVLADALDILTARFAQVVWTPGNHDLWSDRTRPDLRGAALYDALISVCRDHNCRTPEDPFLLWDTRTGPLQIAPIFTLYDYSFAPDGIAAADAVDWAVARNVHCMDEVRLDPDPYRTVCDWCRARLALTEDRLTAARRDCEAPILFVSHFPLRRSVIRLGKLAPFAIWCGSRATEDWPERFHAPICVHGHLHQRGTILDGNIRFEEVSLGGPGQWRPDLGIDTYLRRIMD